MSQIGINDVFKGKDATKKVALLILVLVLQN